MAELLRAPETITDLYCKLVEAEPKPITGFVPVDSKEQREAFLQGDVRNPRHAYPCLQQINFHERQEAIDRVGELIVTHPALDQKYCDAYRAFVERYIKQTRFIELARDIGTAEQNVEAEAEFMRLNIELYGEPDELTYRSLLQETLVSVCQKDLTGYAETVRHELMELVPDIVGVEPLARFRPAPETVQWMYEVSNALYGDMLRHVPEQPSFNEREVRDIFETVVREEFGDSASDWKVDIEAAKSIKVMVNERRIVIPQDRGNISRRAVRKLIAHEIGVHMLSSVMGGQTDLELLRSGLDNYYDAEEGLGMVMEQAIDGVYRESGVGHYITAGLAYFEGKDFRDVFEVKWRLSALAKVDAAGVLIEADVEKAKETAYKATMRIFRGTDTLPWFKDLAYYNGAASMWRHLEATQGDDLLFSFLLLGKADPANSEHARILREVRVNPATV